ncbi:unnamed protein product [Ilex paraguariensis]|uniref:non-specific serine/threonine protein kinase n=1 Tax=Ilex paraguariensis TaxID=185542 RepID=A0ABC8RV79_9AQUA
MQLSKTNYTNGRFQLHMQGDDNVVLYIVSVLTEILYCAYWYSGTVHPNSTSRLTFDVAGYIYVEEGTPKVYNLTRKGSGLNQDFYLMARIDYDGVFTQYSHPRNNCTTSVRSCTSSWSVVHTIPPDMCTLVGYFGSGARGYNSYCVINKDGKPHCLCPEGYSMLDPLDPQKGCKPNFQFPSCQLDGGEPKIDLIDFTEQNNTDWFLSDYDLQIEAEVDKETCKQYCLRDCFCAAVVYNGNNCWKKKFPLSHGRQSVSLDRTTLIKKQQNLQPVSSMNVRRYAYKDLEKATDSFKQQLGKGSFGTVYKGILGSDPWRYVAVKKLEKMVTEGKKEFRTEVSVIGQTHHKNLVCLLGYCDEGEYRLLLYEYMSNGSLASLLFGIFKPDWNQRQNIAFEVARGFMYLHEECSTQVIHCDIKPQNILLDDSFTARISDFGLAKLLMNDQTRTDIGIRGTKGYVAPEWFRNIAITAKVDVYSYGVMLLEIICCRRKLEMERENEEEAILFDWAYDCNKAQRLDKLVDDEEVRNHMNRLEKLVMVAIWCIQDDPSLRTSMKKVILMFEGVVQVPAPPVLSVSHQYGDN